VAWTAPMTAVTGAVFTAAEFNLHVRDNLLETEAAKATPDGGLLLALGFHIVGFRGGPEVGYIGDFEATASATYDDLNTPGPYVVMETGGKALVSLGAEVLNSNAGLGSRMSYEVSGATSQGAADANSFYAESGNVNDRYQGTWTTITTTLGHGLNLFEAKYRTTAGGGTSTFGHRLLTVIPF